MQNKEIGYGQSNYFKELIAKHNINHKENIFVENKQHYQINNDIELILLSPYKENLDNLEQEQKKWEEKRKKEGNKLETFCNGREVKEISIHFKTSNSDETITNSSSIAFILKYQNQQFLFLADANINIINSSLINLGYSKSNPLKVDFIKLSHHGSKFNINQDFLNIIQTDKYVILTNGQKYNHPDEETLKLILEHHRLKDNKAYFIFNYKDFFIKKIKKYKNYNFKYSYQGTLLC